MRKVRWGVLGTADIAYKAVIPAMLTADNCALYAVAGRSLEKAQRFQREFGFDRAYGDYQALLEDPGVEAVYLPLSNELHAPWAIRALEAGKHVLCEKPLALNAQEAERMFRAAEANGVHLMEAYAYLHSPFMDAVKGEVEAGAIGDIVYMDAAFLNVRRPENDFRLVRQAGGGSVYDLGCYAVSMILWMMGREPRTVQASARFSPQGIDLLTSALLSFEDGAAATLDCGMFLDHGRIDRFRIHGAKGDILSDVRFNQSGEIGYTVAREGASTPKTVIAPNNYRLEVEQLGRCILGGETPRVSKDFSLMVARTLDRILEAIGY